MTKTDLETAIGHAAFLIEQHLLTTGKWRDAQKAAAHRFDEAPIPIIGNQGTHLCRESSMFARNMLAAAGFEGWEVESGEVSLKGIENFPLEIEELVRGDDDHSLDHTWLVNREKDLLLDMTASQFGYEFWNREEPMLTTLQQADDYHADETQMDWYDPDFDLAETVGAWLNLGDGVPATRESQPQGRHPLSPIEQIVQSASGTPVPEGYDDTGVPLMKLLEELREIRQSLSTTITHRHELTGDPND